MMKKIYVNQTLIFFFALLFRQFLFAQTTTSLFSATNEKLCPPISSTTLTSDITGTNYEWQTYKTDSGFVNIKDDYYYSNTASATLNLSHIPSSWYGSQYRCVVNGMNSRLFIIWFTNAWTNTISKDWKNPGNWSCGSVPDSNTDVIIVSGKVDINSNIKIRSLSLQSPSSPSINSINPYSGQPETLITISGTNFSTVTTENIVKFNGIAATVTSASAWVLVVKVPIGAGSGLVTVSTSKGTSSGLPFSYIPDIYIGGSEGDANETNSVAKYWKNGTPVPITDSTKFVFIYSMALSGSDVYLAGSEPNANGIYVAKYWKNGVATELSDGRYTATIYSLIVIGSDIYAVGRESNGTNTVAKYWKNGIAVALTDGTRNATAWSLFVSGNDVYVAGEDAADNGVSVAKYWKNSIGTVLTNNTNISYSAMEIAVAGNDVHIVINAFDSSNTYQYWKNGTSIPISGATQIDQLLIVGNDVYMVGKQSKIAAYWKNGIPVPLTDGSNVAFAHSIALYGNDVYVTGNEYNGSVKVGKYWKNGVPTNITDDRHNVSPWSIIVR